MASHLRRHHPLTLAAVAALSVAGLTSCTNDNTAAREADATPAVAAAPSAAPVAPKPEPAAPAAAPGMPTSPGFVEAIPLSMPRANAAKPANAAEPAIAIPDAPKTKDVDDPALAEAATAARQMFDNAREAGDRPTNADMGDYADKAVAKWDLKNLSTEQIARLITTTSVIYGEKSKPALDAILLERSKATDADGAQAALARLQLLPFTADNAERVTRVNEVLAHPGLAAAFAKGAGVALLTQAATISEADAAAVKAMAPKFNALAGSGPSDAPVSFYADAAKFQIAIAHALKGDEVKAFEPLRAAIAKGAEAKARAPLAEQDKSRLETAVAQLNGAFARGELVGHPAPNIEFIAFNDPANPSSTVHSLADLKGKVVVLDFWATWCGPCVASFPKVKAVSRYYRGYDVVVVGVTSPQGRVVLGGASVDTEADVNKEVQLTTTQFRQEKDMTWPIAVAKQNVFNPDYGIVGIPSVAIIDTKGIVRYAGLHPASDLDEKINMIDPLLAEGGKPLPARLMMTKPNTGG